MWGLAQFEPNIRVDRIDNHGKVLITMDQGVSMRDRFFTCWHESEGYPGRVDVVAGCSVEAVVKFLERKPANGKPRMKVRESGDRHCELIEIAG